MKIRIALIGLLALASTAVFGAGKKEIVLNPQHPDHYQVAAGDTLWEVAGKFLRDPWQWPELWGSDRQATRPLRPGDELTLVEVDGRPRLQLTPGNGIAEPAAVHVPGEKLPVVKLSPKVRVSPVTDHIPVIPMNSIRAFLSAPRVLSEDEFKKAPYVLDFPETRMTASTGEKVYVRGLGDEDPHAAYGLFHKGSALYDYETREELGYEAVYVSDLTLVEQGDPATFLLSHAFREARVNDRLLRLDEEHLPSYYEPHAPDFQLRGHVIGILGAENIGFLGGLSRVGHYSVVVLDRGRDDGLEVGHVLGIYHGGRTVNDKISGIPYDRAGLPEEAIGHLLIFRPFERVSFALVMSAARELHAGDVVQTP